VLQYEHFIAIEGRNALTVGHAQLSLHVDWQSTARGACSYDLWLDEHTDDPHLREFGLQTMVAGWSRGPPLGALLQATMGQLTVGTGP
jgi:hypothetical protein